MNVRQGDEVVLLSMQESDNATMRDVFDRLPLLFDTCLVTADHTSCIPRFTRDDCFCLLTIDISRGNSNMTADRPSFVAQLLSRPLPPLTPTRLTDHSNPPWREDIQSQIADLKCHPLLESAVFLHHLAAV